MKLTAKQERFCQEVVLKRKTYSDAYRAAYDTSHSKPKSVWERASELRAHTKVSARIVELQAKMESRLLLTRQQWLEKLEGMATADVRNLFDDHGNVRNIPELADAEADLIEGIEFVENFEKVGDKVEHVGYTKKVKLASRRQLLKEYGEARGWLEKEREMDGDGPIVLRDFIAKEVHIHVGQTPHTSDTLLDHGDGIARNGHGGVPADYDRE